MDEDTDPLVARPRYATPLRLGAEAAVHLRDRKTPVVEPIQCCEQTGRDPGCEREHGASVDDEASRVCAESPK
jgi:hypothetical protein